MKIVMCCSNGKNGSNLIYNGTEVSFVAKSVLPGFKGILAHPDSLVPDDSLTWRKLIEQKNNELGMLEAYALYENLIYKKMYEKFGNDLYIYSAGWGIVNAKFKLPKYNITFSKQSEEWAKRTKVMKYNDFNHLNCCDDQELIVLISGEDYIEPFYALTKGMPNRKVVVCSGNGAKVKVSKMNDERFSFVSYETKKKTNWHYEYAEKLVSGKVSLI